MAPHSLLPASQRTPAFHPAGPRGPGGAQQGPEPSRPGSRECPLHHQAHEPLTVGQPAPGPWPEGLLPLLMAFAAHRQMAGQVGRHSPSQRSAEAIPEGPVDPSQGTLSPVQALSAQSQCFQNGRVLVFKRSNFPGDQPLKEVLGLRPPSVQIHFLGVSQSCTCPPPANNNVFYIRWTGSVLH